MSAESLDKDLISEIANLQQVLDSEDINIDLDDILPTLESSSPKKQTKAEIAPQPKSQETTSEHKPETSIVKAEFSGNEPLLKAINEQSQLNEQAKQKPIPKHNPFLPDDALQKLAVERQAAQDTATEASRSLHQILHTQKAQEEHQETPSYETHAFSYASVNSDQKEQIIDELVAELIPVIELRLRKKLAKLF